MMTTTAMHPARRHTASSRTLAILASLTVLLLLAACEEQPTEADDYVPEPMLYAWLEGGAPADTISLKWTTQAKGSYDRANAGILDAEVVLFPILDQNGATIDTAGAPDLVAHYEPVPGREGYGDYAPVGTVPVIQTLWTYRIEVRKPAEGVDLWAETEIPGEFDYYAAFKDDPDTPVEVDGRTLTRDDDEIYVVWEEAPLASGYVLGIVAQTPKEELIPLDPEWDPNDPDDELEDNERNRHGWTFARDDQRGLTVAWIFFDWAGWNDLYINAVSESYFSYMITLINRGDPSFTENPGWNVQGGLGIVAGYTQQRFSVFLERVEEQP